MEQTVRYILSFLLYGNDAALDTIAYAHEVSPDTPYALTIVGDGIDSPLHYPDLSEPQIEQLANGHYVVKTDLVYNTFFFISRAEEVLNQKRDEHGRFLACYSRFDTSYWQTPIIDKYSQLIHKLLNLPTPPSGFAAIHLTHDIDMLTQYRHLRGAMGGICRGQIKQVLAAWKDIHNDPAYTFTWMMEQDAQCLKNAECRTQKAECIYFVKHTSGKGLDYPQYNLHGRDWPTTQQMLTDSGAQLGVHSSAYASTPLPEGTLHRSHFLSCSIERIQELANKGYTDDYTMGFADLAGFRLQTTRPVRWINPHTLHLSPLTLHPLTIMDCTLSNEQYMHLNEEDAYAYAAQLIDTVRKYHGEVNLLWHNTVFTTGYHRSLYPKILALL